MENNRALALIFHHMADCYWYLGTENQFRAIAYENVSKTVQSGNYTFTKTIKQK